MSIQVSNELIHNSISWMELVLSLYGPEEYTSPDTRVYSIRNHFNHEYSSSTIVLVFPLSFGIL